MQSRSGVAQPLTAVAATGTFIIGIVVLAGWALDVEPMRRVFVSNIQMLPNTAFGFVAGSLSLWLLRREDRSPSSSRVAALLAAIVLLLGVITSLERAFDWNAGIDLVLFPDLVRAQPYMPPGRMVGNSSLAMTLGGIGLLFLDVKVKNTRPTAVFATLGVTIASVAMVGYLYNAQSLYFGDRITGMALATAVAFFLWHAGLLAARPSGGMALLLGSSDAGMVARRILLSLVVVPLLLGKLYIFVRSETLLTRETGIAILVTTIIGILVLVTVRSALAIETAELERRATLDREAAARQEAERAIKAKNDFLAVMSHELRTPLNAIIGYSSLLHEGIPDVVSDSQRRQLDRITSSARHLLALIDEILTLTRMELGDDRLVPTEVKVRQVMEEAAAMVEPQAQAKSLRFVINLPDEALTMQSDAKKLRQALVNVLGNAVKFTDAGSIEFGVQADEGGNLLSFQVEDTGKGIPAEHLEHVFDSFWQVDQAPTRRAGGVGLGLYVTRQLVRLLGGDVSVVSEFGAGSCFTLTLPRFWWAASTAEFSRATPASVAAVSEQRRKAG